MISYLNRRPITMSHNNSHKNIHNISNRYKYFNGSSSACFYPWCNKCGLRKFICSHAFGDDGGIFVASVFG